MFIVVVLPPNAEWTVCVLRKKVPLNCLTHIMRCHMTYTHFQFVLFILVFISISIWCHCSWLCVAVSTKRFVCYCSNGEYMNEWEREFVWMQTRIEHDREQIYKKSGEFVLWYAAIRQAIATAARYIYYFFSYSGCLVVCSRFVCDWNGF